MSRQISFKSATGEQITCDVSEIKLIFRNAEANQEVTDHVACILGVGQFMISEKTHNAILTEKSLECSISTVSYTETEDMEMRKRYNQVLEANAKLIRQKQEQEEQERLLQERMEANFQKKQEEAEAKKIEEKKE